MPSTGPYSNDFVIPSLVKSDTYQEWMTKFNNQVIEKLNLLKVYQATGTGGITVSTSLAGIATIQLGSTIDGDKTFTGDVTFNGDVITINANEVTIDDYILVLGATNGGTGVSDSAIEALGGGGLRVAGSSGAKDILWRFSPEAAWNFSESMRIASSKAFLSGDSTFRFRGSTGGLQIALLPNGASQDNVMFSYGFSGSSGITAVQAIKIDQNANVTVFNGVNNKRVTQASHGLTFGNPVRYDATLAGFTAALADTATNAEVVGIVSGVSGDIIDITFIGEISGNFASVLVSGSTLSPGEAYFLSAATAGKISSTAPSADGQIRKPVLLALGANTGIVLHYVGAENVDEDGALTLASGSNRYFITSSSVLEVGTGVLSSADPASAAIDATSEAIGIVTAVVSATVYEVTLFGVVDFPDGITLSNGQNVDIEEGSVYFLGTDGLGRLTLTPPDGNPNIIKPMIIGLDGDQGLVVSRNGFGAGEVSEENAGVYGKTFIPSSRGWVMPYASVGTLEFDSYLGDMPGDADTDPSVFVVGWYPPTGNIDPNDPSNLATIQQSNVLFDTEASFGDTDLASETKWIAYNVNLELDMFEEVPSAASHALIQISSNVQFRQNIGESGQFSLYAGKYFFEDEALPNFYSRDDGTLNGMLDGDGTYEQHIRSFITKFNETVHAANVSSDGLAEPRNVDSYITVPLTLVAESGASDASHLFTILSRIQQVASADIQLKVVGYLIDIEPSAFPNPYGETRNKVINGNFYVWQRGQTFGFGSGATYGYFADRWMYKQDALGCTAYVSQQSTNIADQSEGISSNCRRYARIAIAPGSTGNYLGVQQFIARLRSIRDGFVSLSFWARSDIADAKIQPMLGRLYNASANEVGGVTAQFVAAEHQYLSSTWQKFTVVFDAPTLKFESTTANDRNAIYLMAGVTGSYSPDTTQADFGSIAAAVDGTFWPGGVGYIDIAQVQLEEGARVTNFEFANVMAEMNRCSYFYQKSLEEKSDPSAISSVTFAAAEVLNGAKKSIRFPVPMFQRSDDINVRIFTIHGVENYGSIDSTAANDVPLSKTYVTSKGFLVTNSSVQAIIDAGKASPATLTTTVLADYLFKSNVFFHWTADAEIHF